MTRPESIQFDYGMMMGMVLKGANYLRCSTCAKRENFNQMGANGVPHPKVECIQISA